jgi:hypothetical protein
MNDDEIIKKNKEIARQYGYTDFDFLLGDIINSNGDREYEGRKWHMSKPGEDKWHILPDYIFSNKIL